jgi:hypothetical protein
MQGQPPRLSGRARPGGSVGITHSRREVILRSHQDEKKTSSPRFLRSSHLILDGSGMERAARLPENSGRPNYGRALAPLSDSNEHSGKRVSC